MGKIFTTEIDINALRSEPLKSDLECCFGRNCLLHVEFEITKWDVFPPEPQYGIFHSRYEPLIVEIISILCERIDVDYTAIEEENYDVNKLKSVVSKHLEEICIEDAQDNDWASQAAEHYSNVNAEHRMEQARESELE